MGAALLLGLALIAAAPAAPGPDPVVADRPPAVVTGPVRVLSLRVGDAVVFRSMAAANGADLLVLREGAAARDQRLAPGEVRAQLSTGEDGGALLTIENTNRWFVAYQAVMTLPDGSSVPTSVCALLPNGQPSYEHWPHGMAVLTLFGFHRATDAAIDCG